MLQGVLESETEHAEGEFLLYRAAIQSCNRAIVQSCNNVAVGILWNIYYVRVLVYCVCAGRLRNFVFSTKILVGNTCGVAEFCLFMNYLTEVFSIRTWNTYRLYVDFITSFQVPRSTKASEKYLEQGRFMIIFI